MPRRLKHKSIRFVDIIREHSKAKYGREDVAQYLRELHYGREWSIRYIAKRYNVTHVTVIRCFKEFDVPARNTKQQTDKALRRLGYEDFKDFFLSNPKLSFKEMAGMLEIGYETVRFYHRKFKRGVEDD